MGFSLEVREYFSCFNSFFSQEWRNSKVKCPISHLKWTRFYLWSTFNKIHTVQYKTEILMKHRLSWNVTSLCIILKVVYNWNIACMYCKMTPPSAPLCRAKSILVGKRTVFYQDVFFVNTIQLTLSLYYVILRCKNLATQSKLQLFWRDWIITNDHWV